MRSKTGIHIRTRTSVRSLNNTVVPPHPVGQQPRPRVCLGGARAPIRHVVRVGVPAGLPPLVGREGWARVEGVRALGSETVGGVFVEDVDAMGIEHGPEGGRMVCVGFVSE